MAKRIIPFILLLSCCFATSCESVEFEDEYQQSYNIWLGFKKSSANSYMYVVKGASWSGVAWETTITVSDGTVIKREFNYVRFNPEFENLEGWIEDKDNIGSHQNTSAAAPLTLDEVYKKSKNEWLSKRKGFTTYFETENNGMISLCGYVEDNCADDCFIGISISSIAKL